MAESLRILNLEDNVNDSALIRAVLEEEGMKCLITRVETEKEFTEALDRGGIDIILADFKLPGVDSLTALTVAVERQPDVPFIFVTATMGDEIAVESLKKGATDYVIKDSLARLAPSIRKALKEKRDRLEHMLTEQALQKSDERYRRITEAISDYVYSVRVENGMPVETRHSEACSVVTGYTSEEFSADPYLWFRMVIDEDRPLVAKQAEEVLSGHFPQPVEHRIIRKDGSMRWVESTVVPSYDINSFLISYDGILRDITERKNLEEQLLHAQKMEALGHLAGGIAHDFNNIMSAIVNYTYLLKNELKENENAQDQVNHIVSLSMKASEITRGLLAFSRKHLINPVPLNINYAVKNMEKLLSKFIGEDVQLDLKLADNDLVIMADSAQIEQIIINLATNARDAMPDGGRLSIETEMITIDEIFIKMHGFGVPGSYALLSVTDTGFGMDEETRQKIFEPFFTTKEVGKGTGLGLAIIYGIVKQHEGYINVYSRKGVGTTFRIYFRMVTHKLPEAAVSDIVDLSGKGETILLAEDEEAVRSSTRFLLEKFGYNVFTAVNGEDAIQTFREHKDTIDLLLLDVIMPGKNGGEVYEEIRRISPEIKAIFISGYSAEIIDKKGMLKKGFVHVSKPVLPGILFKTIREVMYG